MYADVPHGAPGDEGASLQGAVLWAEFVLGFLVSQVEALVLLCSRESLLGAKDTWFVGAALGRGFAPGAFTVISPPVPA